MKSSCFDGSSPVHTTKRTTRRSFTKNLSKRWNNTRHQIEKELDFYLMECKLNILIPSDNSIELIFFFVKEIDLSEEENLDIPLDSDKSKSASNEKGENNDDLKIKAIKVANIDDIDEELKEEGGKENGSMTVSSLNLSDVPNLDEKIQFMGTLRSAIMPPPPNILDSKKENSTKKGLTFNHENEEEEEQTFANKNLSPLHSTRKKTTTLTHTSKNKETYKTYLTKKMESHKSNVNNDEKSPAVIHNSEHSKMKTNSEKIFQLLDLARKNNKIMIDHEMKSEQNSQTSSTMALSKKFLKNTINIHYIPRCFTYLKYGLIMSIFLIYVSQIINTVFVVTTYQTLTNSFSNDVIYEKLGPLILRTLNTSYKLILMKAGVLPDDQTSETNLNNLLLNDSELIMNCIQYLNDNRPQYYQVSQSIYDQSELFWLDDVKRIPLKFTDAFVFYVSKIVSFANEKTYQLFSKEFFFMIKNYQTLLQMTKNADGFGSFNDSKINFLEIECLCLVFIALALVMVFMVYRIKYYLDCYTYMNKIFKMLIGVSYEDMNVLKGYMSDAVIFFKHDKQSKHLINNKIISSLNHAGLEKETNKDKNHKNQRKSKSCEIIALPLRRLIPFNFLLYLIILGGYLALLSFSNIFNKDLSDKAFLKNIINSEQYLELSNSFVYLYDNMAANKLKSSYYNNSQQYLLDYYQNLSSTQSFTFLKTPVSETYYEYLFALFMKENLCQVLYNGNKMEYPDFFGTNYFELSKLNENSCTNLLNNAMTQGFCIYITINNLFIN